MTNRGWVPQKEMRKDDKVWLDKGKPLIKVVTGGRQSKRSYSRVKAGELIQDYTGSHG